MDDFSIDSVELEIPCPECGFYNDICFRQARLRDVIICRGCKRNIHLDDHMNECKNAERSIRKSLKDFAAQLGSMKIEIKL